MWPTGTINDINAPDLVCQNWRGYLLGEWAEHRAIVELRAAQDVQWAIGWTELSSNRMDMPLGH